MRGGGARSGARNWSGDARRNDNPQDNVIGVTSTAQGNRIIYTMRLGGSSWIVRFWSIAFTSHSRLPSIISFRNSPWAWRLLIVVLKTIALRRNDETYHQAARFWARIFGINFVMGVVTGIPMEFQFGTNWSHFSRFAGGVIGQTLAMEGMFAFFLESAFLGLFLYGEKRLSPRAHWWSAVAVFLGSWLSGFFIIATDAWMQHPVGFVGAKDGSVQLSSFWELVLNPWAWWQYAHNMGGAVITGAFVMASVGAFYLLWGKFEAHARIFVRVGVVAGLIFSVLQLFPDRRWSGADGCPASAGHARSHGSSVREPDGSAAGDPGAAECG